MYEQGSGLNKADTCVVRMGLKVCSGQQWPHLHPVFSDQPGFEPVLIEFACSGMN